MGFNPIERGSFHRWAAITPPETASAICNPQLQLPSNINLEQLESPEGQHLNEISLKGLATQRSSDWQYSLGIAFSWQQTAVLGMQVFWPQSLSPEGHSYPQDSLELSSPFLLLLLGSLAARPVHLSFASANRGAVITIRGKRPRI